MPASFKHLTDPKVNDHSLLARWKDGLYYTAVLTKSDRANGRCRVCFEDGSEVWLSNRDLHIQLTLDQLDEDEDIVCCICDDGSSEPPNEIILCDVCNQGYHQKCHQPSVDASKLDDSEESKDHKDWFCATCSYILNQTNRAKLSATVAAAQQRQTTPAPKSNTSMGPTSPKQPRLQSSQPAVATSSSLQQQPNKTKPSPAKAEVNIKSTSAVVQPQAVPTTSITTAVTGNQPPIVRQAPKVKQTPIIPQQQLNQKSTIASTKTGSGQHQRSAPYYPLSNQVKAAGMTSSTAALASMTASSALIVGSSAGRSKLDLVKQSSKSTQRQQLNNEAISNSSADGVSQALPKHAVRKSSINFVVSPVKQSALPTATRSSPALSAASVSGTQSVQIIQDPSGPQTLSTTSHSSIAKPIITMTVASSTPTVTSQTNASYTITALTNQSKATDVNIGKIVRVDSLSTSSTKLSVNGQMREPRSVISAVESQTSGLSAPSSIETNTNSKASTARSIDQLVGAKRSGEVASLGNNQAQKVTPNIQVCMATDKEKNDIKVPSSQKLEVSSNPASMEETTISETNSTTAITNNSGNGNKSATVIVGGTIK